MASSEDGARAAPRRHEGDGGPPAWSDAARAEIPQADAPDGGGVQRAVGSNSPGLAEAALQDSETKYRTLFNSIDEGFFLCEVLFDANDRPVDLLYLEVNPAAIRIVGHDFTGERLSEFGPDYETYWYEIFGRVACTGQSERLVRFASPVRKWFDFHVFKIGADNSRRIAVVFQDITARKSAEEQLSSVAASNAFRVALNDALQPLTDPRAIQTTAARVLGESLGASRVHYGDIAADDAAIHIGRNYTVGVPVLSGVFPMADFGPAVVARLRRGETIVMNDVATDSSLSEAERAANLQLGVSAQVGVPLIKGGRLTAVLAVHNAAPRVWTEQEIAQVRETAERTWTALEYTRTMEALRQSEERLSSIFARATVGLSEISLEGRFLRVNDELCRITGRSRDELLRRGVPDVTHPDDVPASLAVLRQLLESGQPGALDKRYLKPDGTVVWGHSSLSLLLDKQGQPQSLLAVTVDMTERRRAEQAVRESEERFRLLVEGTPGYAMFLMGADRHIVHWNSGAERIFGYSREEALGRSGDLIFTPEDRAAGVPEQESALAAREGRAPDMRWHLRKDGSRFWADGIMSSLQDDSGRLRGFVKICRDATGEKEAEEALQLAHDELELRVQERTSQLRREVEQRRQAEHARERLLRRVVRVQEEERRRISRELHDQMGQQLTALLMGLKMLKPASAEPPAGGLSAGDRAPAGSPTSPLATADSTALQLERLHEIASTVMQQMHHLAWELRPATLDTFGLQVALGQYVKEWQQRTGVAVDFMVHGLPDQERVKPDIETALYRLVQEALTNVHRHAGASQVSVLLERRNDKLVAIVEDNGCGFEVEQDAAGKPCPAPQRLGLLGMMERLESVAGTLVIESAPGQGTTVYASVPV